MRFRPCIDIHNGKVKQIVGGTLRDEGDQARENFVSGQDASFYARLYRSRNIRGGHIILLNPQSSEYYPKTKAQAMEALAAYPGGLMVGGGIHSENAGEFLDAGASHVIVTSHVFRDGKISWERLEQMVRAVGKEHLVLDLSCRRRDGKYYIVTDRWQKFTQVEVDSEVLETLRSSCDEFLIHAVDVEGRASGIEKDLVRILAGMEGFPITYAGGIGSFADLEELRTEGLGRLDVTIGSALDLFGGTMGFERVLAACDPA